MGKDTEFDVLGMSRLAELFGISRNAVDNWLGKGCPGEKKNGTWHFNLKAVEEWRKSREKQRQEVDPELTKQRARLVRLTADRRELQLKQERGALIRSEIAQRAWAAVMMNFLSRVDAVEHELPPLVVGLEIAEVQNVVRRFVHELRNELSNPDLSEITANYNKQKSAKGKKRHGKRTKN